MAKSPATQYVVESLRNHGASLFAPMVGADDVDLAVRGADGQYVEVQVVLPESGAPSQFRMGRFRPKAHVFFVCVVSQDGTPTEAWVLPSSVFERFAGGVPLGEIRVLDLDSSDGEPLRERLSVYRERWALIADYVKFRSTLPDPISLQMMIAMTS